MKVRGLVVARDGHTLVVRPEGKVAMGDIHVDPLRPVQKGDRVLVRFGPDGPFVAEYQLSRDSLVRIVAARWSSQ